MLFSFAPIVDFYSSLFSLAVRELSHVTLERWGSIPQMQNDLTILSGRCHTANPNKPRLRPRLIGLASSFLLDVVMLVLSFEVTSHQGEVLSRREGLFFLSRRSLLIPEKIPTFRLFQIMFPSWCPTCVSDPKTHCLSLRRIPSCV